jgi:hypothetical protein
VLSTQQILRKAEAAQHIKTRAGDADGRDRMVVHAGIVELTVSDCSSMTCGLESIRIWTVEPTLPKTREGWGSLICGGAIPQLSGAL